MRNFFVFITGMLAAVIILGLSAWYFLFSAGEGGGKSGQNAVNVAPPKLESATSAAQNNITLTVTVVAPPSMKVKPGGALLFQIVKDPTRNMLYRQFALGDVSSFPAKVEVSVSRKDMLEFSKDSDRLVLFSMVYSERAGVTPTTNEARHYGTTIPKFKEEDIPAVGGKLDLGAIYLTSTRTHALDEPCIPGTSLIAGTITPSAAFLQAYAAKHFALMAIDGSIDLREKPSQADIDYFTRGYKEIDFRKGVAAFDFPLTRPGAPPALNLFLVECEPGEALKACLVAGFPILNLGIEKPRHRFKVVLKDFAEAFCGSKGVEGFVHDHLPRAERVPLISIEKNKSGNPIEEVPAGVIL